MLAQEKNRRQAALEKEIYKLSEELLNTDEEVRGVSLELLEIYKGDFRHSYQGFFPIIVEIHKDGKYSTDYLTQNLERLCEYIESDFVSGTKEFVNIYGSLNKLCDNLNTEIGRWSHYSQNDQQIEDINNQITFLNGTMSGARRELAKASKQAASIQTELIAVLSIFAAIVVTFSGGFTFLGSVMTSVNGAKYYEAVVLEAIVCGIVIFNTIFLLMYMVGKITERNIYARCKTPDCSCNKRCNNINRMRKRLPYVFYFNVVSIVGIIVDCAVWYFTMQMGLGL